MDAFDADVLIYAASGDHPLGRPVRSMFLDADGMWIDDDVGIGSVLLDTEVLAKPARLGHADELVELARLLVRLDLLPVGTRVASAATALASKYGLKPLDAVHLATAVEAGADRFITNNRRDFDDRIDEIDIVSPADLGANGLGAS